MILQRQLVTWLLFVLLVWFLFLLFGGWLALTAIEHVVIVRIRKKTRFSVKNFILICHFKWICWTWYIVALRLYVTHCSICFRNEIGQTTKKLNIKEKVMMSTSENFSVAKLQRETNDQILNCPLQLTNVFSFIYFHLLNVIVLGCRWPRNIVNNCFVRHASLHFKSKVRRMATDEPTHKSSTSRLPFVFCANKIYRLKPKDDATIFSRCSRSKFLYSLVSLSCIAFVYMRVYM